MSEHVETEPSQVTACHGIVKVTGPDGVDVLMTPDAAEETSNRLLEGAAKALGQERVNGMMRDQEAEKRRI